MYHLNLFLLPCLKSNTMKTLSTQNIHALIAPNHRSKKPVENRAVWQQRSIPRQNTSSTQNLVAPWEDSTSRISPPKGELNRKRSRPLIENQDQTITLSQSPPFQRPVDQKAVTTLDQNPPAKPHSSRLHLPTSVVERAGKQVPSIPSISDEIISLESTVVSVPALHSQTLNLLCEPLPQFHVFLDSTSKSQTAMTSLPNRPLISHTSRENSKTKSSSSRITSPKSTRSSNTLKAWLGNSTCCLLVSLKYLDREISPEAVSNVDSGKSREGSARTKGGIGQRW